MHHPILLGIIGGLLLGKLLRRFLFRLRARHGGGGCGGGGCGRGRRWGRPRHAAWDAFDPYDRDGGGGGGGGGAPWRRPPVTIDLGAALGKLELNRRQEEEMGEVLATVARAVGVDRVEAWPGLSGALAAVAVAPFDRARVVDGVGRDADPRLAAEAVDALEHAHHILTAEQREVLARAVGSERP